MLTPLSSTPSITPEELHAELTALQIAEPTYIRASVNPNYDDSALFQEFSKTRVKDEEGNILGFDVKLRNKLAEKNMRLVPFVIDKFYGKVPELQLVRPDLMQEGYIGLLESLPKFEPDMGFKFSTYATYWIKQQIGKFLLRNKTAPGIPSHVRIIYNKLLKESKKLEVNLKDLIENEAAMESFGVSVKMTDNVKASMNTRLVVSIHEPTKGKGMGSAGEKTFTLEDLLEAEGDTVEDTHDKQRLISAVARALGTLSYRERSILLLRYNVIEPSDVQAKDLK